MTEPKRVSTLASTCPVCPDSQFASWASHYRTRAHRESLARRRQAGGYALAMGTWTAIRVDGAAWPVHLQVQGDGKYIATIYEPSVGPVDLSAFYGSDRDTYLFGLKAAAMQLASDTRHWRGESYAGIDEALRNAAMVLASSDIPGARA
jgi:hypothetical protein